MTRMIGVSLMCIIVGYISFCDTCEAESSKVTLRRWNALTETAAAEELRQLSTLYNNKEDWKKRAKLLRREILRGMSLDRVPKKNELNPIFRVPRKYKGYSVENVAFESLPGFFVTGNLYRPLGKKGPFAAVLSPHGHFPEPNGGGRFRPDVQIRNAMLARMGAIVYSYDMVGWGESRQLVVPEGMQIHSHPDVMTFQTWNSIRAIDFLYTLSDVDIKRIGVTGASGGGTQTFLLTALDDRIAVSVPVLMVSAHFFGGCICESGKPIHQSEYHKTNNAEIAAMAAPRPLLLVSSSHDWTKNVPEVEFPFIRRIYSFFDMQQNVENVHLTNEHHDYGPSKRAAMYPFMAKHLGLKLFDNIDKEEFTVVIEKPRKMYVFDETHPRPKHAVVLKGWAE